MRSASLLVGLLMLASNTSPNADTNVTLVTYERAFGAQSTNRITLHLISHDRVANFDDRRWGFAIPLYADAHSGVWHLKNKPTDIAIGVILGVAVLGTAYAIAKEAENSSDIEVRAKFRSGSSSNDQASSGN